MERGTPLFSLRSRGAMFVMSYQNKRFPALQLARYSQFSLNKTVSSPDVSL